MTKQQLEEKLKKIYGEEMNLSELIKKGCIRMQDGSPFATAENDILEQLHGYFFCIQTLL